MTGNDITGVVLAGGMSSRFGGTDKAFIQVGGIPMIERVLQVLRKSFEDIIIVTNSPGNYRFLAGCRIVTDRYPGRGPLGGIHAAMLAASTPFIFVVSCDMPFLDGSLIDRQIRYSGKQACADAFIPRTGARIEPMHAIYSTALCASLSEFLETSTVYSVRRFLENRKVVWFELDGTPAEIKAFRNINSPADLPGQT